jgi:hypothetical protein
VGPFRRHDSVCFANEFFKAVHSNRSAEKFVDELETRGLHFIVTTPLLLSLACVVRSARSVSDVDPGFDIPTNSVDLLNRAIALLIARWDDERGVNREYVVPLDGVSRVQCLKKIAATMPSLKSPRAPVVDIVTEFLRLKQLPGVDVDELLTEIAQGFGIFIRTKDNTYQFVHSALHDFLSAQYSVETGRFSPARVEAWDTRAGYAASLTGDATQSMMYALRHGLDNVAFYECLANQAPFDPDRLSLAVLENLKHVKGTSIISHLRLAGGVELKMPKEFFSLASTEFLDSLIRMSSRQSRTWETDVVVGYTIAELWHRHLTVSDFDGQLRIAFQKMYGTLQFTFRVYFKQRVRTVRLSQVFELDGAQLDPVKCATE